MMCRESILRAVTRFSDFGRNVGVFALYVASVAPKASVHCCEPDPKNFEMLENNLKRNHVRA